MIVNDIDIKKYGASVSSKLIQPAEIEIKKSKIGNIYTQLSSEVGFKKITIKILFEAIDRNTAYKNISDFMANFIEEADIKFNNLEHYFHVYLTNSSIEDTEFDEWLYLNLELDGYEYGEEVVEVMDGVTEKTIFVNGNMETPCIVEITPKADLSEITLKGFGDDPIVVRNLVKGNTVVIDGIKGKVTVNGVNKFGDVEMWEFPKLNLMKNDLIATRNICSIKVRYRLKFV
ncbi:phage tail protein [uncultured Clostridium sp.]|uniref:phage distal tail protein n=1 Tax=uncultured Clostridium sp. TaxID=59620 RepID=UPI0025F9EE0E|nr:phage tail protein [uncultured Clostridium sp.]